MRCSWQILLTQLPSEGSNMVGMISFYLSEIFNLTGNHLRT